MSPFDVDDAKVLAEPLAKPAGSMRPCQACRVRHMTICGSLEDDELAEMAALARAIELAPGDPLFDEGAPATQVFNVTAGTVKVYKLLADGRRQVVGFLFPGDFLGLANDALYAYSAEAVTHAGLCRFPRNRMEVLIGRFPRLQSRLLSVASHELAVAQEQMLVLGRKTAKEKLATFLLSLSRRAADRGQQADPVILSMSRTDIGDYVGLTTETVSRTFTQLRGQGLIALHAGGRVELRQRETLEALAQGG